MKKVVNKYGKVMVFYLVMIILSVGVINRLDKINVVQNDNNVIYESELAVNY